LKNLIEHEIAPGPCGLARLVDVPAALDLSNQASRFIVYNQSDPKTARCLATHHLGACQGKKPGAYRETAKAVKTPEPALSAASSLLGSAKA
jgi:hypothetical protein